MTIADRRAHKTADRVHTEQERKLTRLQRNKDQQNDRKLTIIGSGIFLPVPYTKPRVT